MNKRDNYTACLALLAHYEVEYTTHNNGNHIILHTPKGRIDYWPTTGTYSAKGKVRKWGGIVNMLAWITGRHKEEVRDMFHALISLSK